MTTSPAPAPPSTPSPSRSRALTTVAGGFLMGAADIVPGVSGGTIALVLGIYGDLVGEIRAGAGALGDLARGRVSSARDRLRAIDWWFLIPLGVGILTAIAVLAGALEHLLETQPVAMSAMFLGLVLGSVVLASRLLQDPQPRHVPIALVAAVVTFLLLGLRSGRIEDPSLVIVFVSGAIAICAMILPGVSGSFLLLLIGMYETIIGAVSGRDLLVVAVFAAGTVIGLASFSTFLDRLLERAHDLVLAVLLGVLLGSARVLWPWPAGVDGVGDTRLGAPVTADLPLAGGLFVLGVIVVIGVGFLGQYVGPGEDPVDVFE